MLWPPGDFPTPAHKSQQQTMNASQVMARALGCNVRRSPAGFCFGQCVRPAASRLHVVMNLKVRLHHTAAPFWIAPADIVACFLAGGFIEKIIKLLLSCAVHSSRPSHGAE
jgi:hypothetical protein